MYSRRREVRGKEVEVLVVFDNLQWADGPSDLPDVSTNVVRNVQTAVLQQHFSWLPNSKPNAYLKYFFINIF